MLTSSWLTRRRMVSTSCFLACTMIEFERRSGMISGARSADAPAAGSPPRGGAGRPGAGVGRAGAGGVPGAAVRRRPLADDRRHGPLARALDADDLVEVA